LLKNCSIITPDVRDLIGLAQSRGLGLERGAHNVGPISPFALHALKEMVITPAAPIGPPVYAAYALFIRHWDINRLPYNGEADRWFDPAWLVAGGHRP
jgi:hypothetical protein